MQKLFRAAFAALAVAAFASAACNNTSVDTPTTSSAPEPVATASTPTTPAANPSPSPSPSPVEEPAKAWEVECSATGQMKVIYNGEASHAEVLTYYTSFDGPQQFAPETKILPTGESWTRTFPACSQSDAEPISGRPAGHCYFDKNGAPFTNNAKKVEECRTTPCVPEWRRDEEYEVIYGPWSGPGQSSEESFGAQTVEQYSCGTRTVTYRYTETNSCTRETRTVDVKQEDQTKECEVSCEDQNPPRASISGPSYPTYNPAYTVRYYRLNEVPNDGSDTSDTERYNYCASVGGSFGEHGGDGVSGSTCMLTNQTLSDFNNSGDNDLDVTLVDTDTFSASGGNPISGGASFYNAGSWEVRLLAASSVSEYNGNDPDYVKDSESATVACGQSASRSVSYNWVGHDSEIWWVEVRLNGSFHSKSNYDTNPTN